MTSRLLMAAVVGACLITSPASAQTEGVTAEKTKLAGELVAASGGAEQIDRVLAALYGQMRSLFDQAADPDAKRLGGLVIDRMQAEMTAMTPKILAVTTNVYATDLTEEELRSLLAWQTSAVGQSVAKKMPQIMRESILQMLPAMQQAMQRMSAGVVADVCRQQQCTPEQREKITAIMNKAMPPSSS